VFLYIGKIVKQESKSKKKKEKHKKRKDRYLITTELNHLIHLM